MSVNVLKVHIDWVFLDIKPFKEVVHFICDCGCFLKTIGGESDVICPKCKTIHRWSSGK